MPDQSENISQNENDVLAHESMDELGEPEGSAEEIEHKPEDDLPEYAKQRLGRQEKRHKREMREMRDQISQLAQQSQSQGQSANMSMPHTMDENNGQNDIQKAVHMALSARDDQERQAKDAEKAKHVHKQYQNLQDQLDSTADKYDDFDKVVRGDDVPFTSSMRDAALLLDNPGEVLYKLAKDRTKLEQISKLHPLDQAKEMVKLSHALMSSGGKSGASPKSPIGQIKNSPVPSQAVNDNTSPAEIRARMKSGNWK